MTIQTTISPDGQRLVTMTAEDYQDLIDARDAEAAMRAVAAGTLQTLSGGDVDAYLAAATPLAFWRKHRRFTQADMAQEIGVSQPYLAQLENGQREGSVSVYQRLARRLGVSVDELLPDEPAVATDRLRPAEAGESHDAGRVSTPDGQAEMTKAPDPRKGRKS